MDDDFLLASLVEEPKTTALVPVVETLAPWPAKLPFDVAFGEPNEVLSERYQIPPEDLEQFFLNPVFRREVADYATVIREEGVTFQAKAKLQAEMYLEEIHTIITNPTVAPSVKLDAIKSMVKWAGYEPKPETAAAGSGQKTQLVIQWQDGSGTVAIQT